MTAATPAYPLQWRWAHEGPVAIGSDAHRQLFCRMLLDTFDPYKPAALDWPALMPDELARLTGLPFWTIAVETEDRASATIAAMAEKTEDPLIREALTLMAFEEGRHRRVLDALVATYGITVSPEPYAPSRRTEWDFMNTGYGECLDSFFAFGLFELAKRSGFFPPKLVETFEPVIQEEGRHIVFFVNWVSYAQANTPLPLRPWFAAKRFLHLVSNGFERLGLARSREEQSANFSKDSVGVDVDMRSFMELCLRENERRLGGLDPRLLRPAVIPACVRVARKLMR